PLPQYDLKSIFTVSLRPARWNTEDKRLADTLFPDMTTRVYALKRDIINHVNISQDRLYDIERNLYMIMERLNSNQAKFEISQTLRELKDGIRFLSGLSLEMPEPPTTHTTPGVIYRPEVKFSQYIYPSLWLPDEIVAINNIFPDLVKSLSVLRRNMYQYKNISESRFRMFEDKLTEIWRHLKGVRAIKEFRDMYRELSHNVSLFTDNRIQFKELTTLPVNTWLMTDFMQRDSGMTDTWLAEDKKTQLELAPSLMHDLRLLATKDNVLIDDIEKIDEKLNKMLSQFKGGNARATVQSIQDSMYRHFINKKIEISRNIHILYSSSPERVFNEPVHIFNNMADSLTFWVDSTRLRHKRLQGIISKIVRIRFINDKILEIQKKEGPSSASKDSRYITLLEKYRDLLSQQSPDVLQRSSLLNSIKSERELSRFIRSVEISLPLHTNQILNEKRGEWGDLLQPTQQNSLQKYVDKYNFPPLSNLTRDFLRYHTEAHIVTELPVNLHVRELRDVLKDYGLYQRLNEAYYTFDDRDTIIRYLLAFKGEQGIFTSEYHPPLSDDIRALVEQYLGENISQSAELHNALIQAVEEKLKNPDTPFNIIPPVSVSAEQIESFQALTVILSLFPIDKWFRHPEWSIPVLSTSLCFSTNGKELTDSALITGGGGKVLQERAFLNYLEMLFDIQQDAIRGTLTEEMVIQKISQNKLINIITKENIRNLLQTLSTNRWKSLTQIHALLMKSNTLAQGWLSVNAERYPILKNLQPYINEQSSTSSLVINEVYEGLKQHRDREAEIVQPEQHKYTLLSWPDFYGNHVKLWSDLADTLHAMKKEFHPQALLITNEGRCMGLSLLYLYAGTSYQYDILKQNLLTAGALLQTRDGLNLPLTLQDNIYLDDTIKIINRLQLQGNKLIQKNHVRKLPWNESNITQHFYKQGASNLLITTPTHTLLIQQYDTFYRVTDPNFGYADFISITDAINFLELSIQITPLIRKHYGLSETFSKYNLSVYIMNKPLFSGLVDRVNLLSEIYLTSQDKLSLRKEKIFLVDREFTWRLLFDIGVYVGGNRINEKSSVKDLTEITINGNILYDYLSRTVLNHEQAEKIKSLLYISNIEPDTISIIPDDIHSVSDEIYLPSYKINKKTQETVKKLSILLEHLHDKFSALMKSKIEPLVKVSLEDTEKGRFSIQINTENDKVQHFSIDASDIVNPFKKSAQIFYDVSGSGILDFELGMNITGIVQYTRILGQKAPVDALSHLNATLDIKQLAESTLGSMIQIAGERFFNHDGIQAFRLETWLANNLRRAASHSSVRLALALNSCARILELPVLESIAGVWGLYSSISELQQAKHHTEIMSARVRVAFDSISLSLTFASIAFPPLMIAVGPVAAIGMGAVSIAHNVASKEERHAQWLKCRQFLVDGSLNVATADPGTGIVDCSGNTVLGNMYLDLREKKPVLHGAPSFNSDLNIGNCPELNDWQIRQRIGYGYSFMPTSSLAQGYANTLWPNTIPSIPEGEYSTVILGYGKQYRANTDIEYLSNILAWREVIHNPESRHALPPLEVLNQQCTVICGKNNTMIIPVRILNELTPERIRYASTFRDYTFIFIGGPGGITVQLGGAGVYKIDTDSSAEKNVLSFNALPEYYDLNFDLSLEKQTIKVNLDGKETPIMEISQRGINTIIGSLFGYNIIKGNAQNNTFYVGYGGGEIYSGSGSNKYIIPRGLTVPLTIYLDEESERNEIILSENYLAQVTLSGTSLELDNGENIWIKGSACSESCIDTERVRIYTNDGFMLSPSITQGKMSLVVTLCDVDRWAKCYPDKEFSPDNILNYLHDIGWSLDQEVTFRMSTMIARYIQSSKNIVWELSGDVSEGTFYGYSHYKTTIYGCRGGHYNLRSDHDSSVFCINLYCDANTPEIIDLRELLPSMVKSEMHNNSLILSVYRDDNNISVQVRYSNATCDAWVYFSPEYKMKLEDIIDVTNKTIKSVILYKGSDITAVNKTISVDNTKEISAHVPSLSSSREIVICLENSGPSVKKVNIQLLSGKLKEFVNNITDLSNIRVSPSTKEYIIFSAEEHVTFTGRISTPPLVITSSAYVNIPKYRWQSIDEIIVSPRYDVPVIRLNDFVRYDPSLYNNSKNNVLYPTELINVSGRDLSVRLLYADKNNSIKTLKLTLRNYFTNKVNNINNPQEIIATTPLLDSSLVNRKYHWKFFYLADKPFSIIGLVSIKNIRNYRLKINKPV
ncbi:DUF3491 domain-containing protein, partial [Escherichia coli]|nr:DUF3491 domain-containing protein [Escherichia coli]